jgi:archaellum biogenesis ATPase FlaH
MSNPIATYVYKDENGVMLYEKLRYPGKRFVQRRPNGKGGWITNLEGIQQVPYCLPELMAATLLDRELPVILTEGEKDCDNVRRLGFPAVSSFKNWKRSFNQYIKGRPVYLIMDKDLAGWKQAEETAAMIESEAASVKIVDLFPGVALTYSRGFDVSDWIADLTKNGCSSEDGIRGDLQAEIDKAPAWKPLAALKQETAEGEASFFKRKAGHEWLSEAMERPRPRMLFGELWHEGELCILFADTNTGKSILAVQVCQSIASGEQVGDFRLETRPQKVVYFDFELSERQFLNRYAVEQGDYFVDPFPFHPNFERVEMDAQCEIPAGIAFEDFLYLQFQQEVVDSSAKIVVVDNITFLRQENEKARNAQPLMRQLKRLKDTYDLSLLVLAHTPKRSFSKPLIQNDLQGSKMLMNLCDSSFAIGDSSQDRGLRYLKQIKERSTSKIYHSKNVPIAEVVKTGNFLHFEFQGFGNERDHLRAEEGSDREMREKVQALRAEGKSFKQIADETGIHYKKAERLMSGTEE